MQTDNLKMNDGSGTLLLSLCMPTNGVSEWVFPSLDSIYKQGIDNDLFEVVIMDNGNDPEFRERVAEYSKKYSNLRYCRTDKELFLSEPESYKNAKGEFIKFVNHRNIMAEGSIRYLLDFVKASIEEKPIVYFTNGNGKAENGKEICSTFGEFVAKLGYFSTWSSGMAVWQSDMDDMKDYEDFNYLFPHTDILFHRRDSKEYIIDDIHLWDELPQGKKPKGKYDLFNAFAVEFLNIIKSLVKSGDITDRDFLCVKDSNLEFLTTLYIDYIIKKKYCSYDLSGYKESLSVYYTKKELRRKISERRIRDMKIAIKKALTRNHGAD